MCLEKQALYQTGKAGDILCILQNSDLSDYFDKLSWKLLYILFPQLV